MELLNSSKTPSPSFPQSVAATSHNTAPFQPTVPHENQFPQCLLSPARNAIRMQDGAKPVGDEQGNLAAFGADFPDRIGDFLLGEGVEGGGGFVE